MALEEKGGDETHVVLVNEVEQYSIWPKAKAIPLGWRALPREGTKDRCLTFIAEVWTDMRPRDRGVIEGPIDENRGGRCTG